MVKKIVEDKDEDGFAVFYPDLPEWTTCGETVESTVENTLDAKRVWLEDAFKRGIEIHEPHEPYNFIRDNLN